MAAQDLTPDRLAAITKQTRILGFLPLVQEKALEIENQIRNNVFRELNGGSLTADKALTAWQEIHALWRLIRKLETDAKIGETAGEILAKTGDIHA